VKLCLSLRPSVDSLHYFVEILPDDRIKDIEVEFSVLVDSEVAKANHSLQSVS
jgi:hypothetical protein